MQGVLYCPFRGGLEQAYPGMVQAWRRTFGKPPLQLQIGQIKALPAPPGSHCVIANGHMDPDGRGMQKYSDLMCASELGGWGVYFVTLSRTLVPNDLAERESDTLKAINASWKIDQALLTQMANAAARQMADNTQAMIRINQQRAHEIQEFGENTVAHMKEVQQEHNIKHRRVAVPQKTPCDTRKP